MSDCQLLAQMSVKLRLGLAEPTGGVTVILLSLDHRAATPHCFLPVQTGSRLGLMAAVKVRQVWPWHHYGASVQS